MQRRTLSARQAVLLDVVLIVVAAGTGLWRDVVFDPSRVRMLALPTWSYAAAQVLGALTLVARRRWPVRVVWVNAVLCLVSPTQAAYVAVYSLGAYARRTVPAGAAFVVLLGCWTLGAQQWRLTDPVTSLVLLCAALLVGLWVRARRALVDSLTERAVRAERERVLSTELALARDRARLAADVHDTVGHWISLMVLLAGALSVSSRDADTRRAAGTIEAYGGHAITELRDVLQQRRGDDETTVAQRPPASAPALTELLARAREGGLVLTCHHHGTPPDPDSTSTVVYRVVQECLTNATRHAPGATVAVVLNHRPGETVVEVTNSRPTTSPTPASEGAAGTGLIGLRQRVGHFGGRLDARPLDDGGFRVRAVLPAPTDTDKDTEIDTDRVSS